MPSNGTSQDVSDALLPVCLFYCDTHSAAEIQNNVSQVVNKSVNSCHSIGFTIAVDGYLPWW